MCQDLWRARKKSTGLRSSAKRIFRYLQCTKTHGICYKPSGKIDFWGYSDAEWAGDLADHKSTSGYVFMLLGAPVSWDSKKKPRHSVWKFKKASGFIACCVRS